MMYVFLDVLCSIVNLVVIDLSKSDTFNRATERKRGGDEMGTDDPAAILFLCFPAQGLLFHMYYHGGSVFYFYIGITQNY